MTRGRDSLLAPDFPRIPHVFGFESRKGPDDLERTMPSQEAHYWLQEKADGSNCGVSWTEQPLIRNRSKILNKAHQSHKDTPAKAQFKPIWNWAYTHEDGIREVLTRLGGPGTIYGEWLWAEHSLHYDRLPDWFLAYDVWSADAQKFVSPRLLPGLLNGTGLAYIQPFKLGDGLTSITEHLDTQSAFRIGNREGVVIKTTDTLDEWVTGHYKIVRSDFQRMDDEWNDRAMKRNELARSSSSPAG